MRISDWSSDVCSSDLDLAALQMRPGRRAVGEHHLHLAAQQVLHGRRAAAIRHMLDAGASHAVEQFARQVRAAARARRAERQCAGILLGIGNQFLDRHDRDRKTVVKGKGLSVRVALGGSSLIKKQKSCNTMTSTETYNTHRQ